MDEIYDVAIVGYGPTGMVAASLLGRAGHRVLVCERWPSLYGMPRFTHIDDETARTIQAAADVDQALRDSTPTRYEWVNGEGDVLLQIPAQAGSMGFPGHISMYQPDVEDAVHRRVTSMPAVDLRQGWSSTSLHQHEDHVELHLRPADDPSAVEQVRARYVLAADGSKSAVRGLLGVDRDDHGFNERWMNVDVEWLRPMPGEFALSKQFCDPARGHMSMGIGKGRQRFEFALLPGEETADFEQPARAWELLREAHDLGPDDVTVIRQIVYSFEARVAQAWRVGRVFLTGDAAHTMPPYLGQGACSGIRDAANLAWKLDLVLRGVAPEALLDTYEVERRPHATALLHMSVGLGRVANMHDPVAAAARDAGFAAGHAQAPPAIPGLTRGVLRDADRFAGSLVPQGRVRSGGRTGRFDDVVGHGFVLVVRAGCAAALGRAQQELLELVGCRVVALGDDVEDLDGVHGGYLDALGADAYLARPDFVLFGAATGADDVVALVEDLRGALSGAGATVPATGVPA